MARAKRTDRSEARRKYRAYLQAQQEAEVAAAEESDGAEVDAGAKPSRSRVPGKSPAPQPGVRMGFLAAARAAYRTPHYLDDIRNIRSLVFGSKAVWPVLLVCAVSGAYLAFRLSSSGINSGSDPIVGLVWQFVFYPVPLLPPMLAGFMAPRSTWLAGLIAGFIATMTLAVVLLVSSASLSSTANSITAVASATPTALSSPQATGSPTPGTSVLETTAPVSTGSPAASPSPSASATGTAAGTGTGSKPGYSTGDLISGIMELLSTSLAFGVLMGALTGWYKRFLSLSSGGPKKSPPSRSGGGRTSQRRRPATRS